MVNAFHIGYITGCVAPKPPSSKCCRTSIDLKLRRQCTSLIRESSDKNEMGGGRKLQEGDEIDAYT